MAKRPLILVILLAAFLFLLISGALAASSAQYTTSWQVLSAGGAPASSNSGHVSMNSTLGQTAIGVSSDGHTTLWTGFWHSIQRVIWDLFLPIIRRTE